MKKFCEPLREHAKKNVKKKKKKRKRMLPLTKEGIKSHQDDKKNIYL